MLLCFTLSLHFQCSADCVKYINGNLEVLSLKKVHIATLWEEHTDQILKGSVQKQHQITHHWITLNKPVTLNSDFCLQANQM